MGWSGILGNPEGYDLPQFDGDVGADDVGLARLPGVYVLGEGGDVGVVQRLHRFLGEEVHQDGPPCRYRLALREARLHQPGEDAPGGGGGRLQVGVFLEARVVRVESAPDVFGRVGPGRVVVGWREAFWRWDGHGRGDSFGPGRVVIRWRRRGGLLRGGRTGGLGLLAAGGGGLGALLHIVGECVVRQGGRRHRLARLVVPVAPVLWDEPIDPADAPDGCGSPGAP